VKIEGKHKRYGEKAKEGWGKKWTPTCIPTIHELQVGMLERIADAMERVAVSLDALVSRGRPKDQTVERWRREAESRDRAWLAYLRACETAAPVEPEPLSVRAIKAMRKLNCDNIAALAGFREIDLLNLKGCGPATVKELAAALAALGLKFREEQRSNSTVEGGAA
jgi:DNA-directed RNA polymerase alpha subunit